MPEHAAPGRALKKAPPDSSAKKAPETIDEYILSQNEAVRPQLRAVREAVRAALPDAEETISWSMPTWRQGRNILHFAAQKNHIGLYPGPEAVAFFSGQLEALGLLYSKGTVRIPYDAPLPLPLITQIAAWCRDTGHHA